TSATGVIQPGLMGNRDVEVHKDITRPGDVLAPTQDYLRHCRAGIKKKIEQVFEIVAVRRDQDPRPGVGGAVDPDIARSGVDHEMAAGLEFQTLFVTIFPPYRQWGKRSHSRYDGCHR